MSAVSMSVAETAGVRTLLFGLSDAGHRGCRVQGRPSPPGVAESLQPRPHDTSRNQTMVTCGDP